MTNPSLRQVYREHTNDSTDYSRGTILYDKKEKKIYVGGDLMYPHFSLGDVVPASFTLEDTQNETVNIDATKAEAYLNSIKPFDFDKIEIQTMYIPLGAAGHGQVFRESNLISFIKENASTEIEAIKNEVLLSYPTASYINITSHNIDDYNPVISYFSSSFADGDHPSMYNTSGLRLPSGFINYSKEDLKNVFESLGLWNTSQGVHPPITFLKANNASSFYVSVSGGTSISYQLEELETVFGITLNRLASTDSWDIIFEAYGMNSTPYVDVYDATDTQLASSVSITSSYLESIYNGNWSPASYNHTYIGVYFYSKIDFDNNQIVYNALLDGYSENLIETWNLYNYGIEITWDQTNIGKLVLAYTPSHLSDGRDGTVPKPTAHNQVLTSDGWANGVPVDIDEFEPPSTLEPELTNVQNITGTPTTQFVENLQTYTGFTFETSGSIEVAGNVPTPDNYTYLSYTNHITSGNLYNAVDNVFTLLVSNYPTVETLNILPEKWYFSVSSVYVDNINRGYYLDGIISIDLDKFKQKLNDELGVTSYDSNVNTITLTYYSSQWSITYDAQSTTMSSLEDWGITTYEDWSSATDINIQLSNKYSYFQLYGLDASHNIVYDHNSLATPLSFNQDDLDEISKSINNGTDVTISVNQNREYDLFYLLTSSLGFTDIALQNIGFANYSIAGSRGTAIIIFNSTGGKSGIVPAPDNRNQTLTSTGWQDTNTYIESAMTAFENNYIWVGTATEFSNINWDSSNPMMDADTGIIYHIIYVVEE